MMASSSRQAPTPLFVTLGELLGQFQSRCEIEMLSENAAAETTTREDHVSRASPMASPAAVGRRFTDRRDADGERPVPAIGIAASDRNLKSIRQREKAFVELLSQRQRVVAGKNQANERGHWLCAHRRQVAEVDGERLPAHSTRRDFAENEIDAVHQRVCGHDRSTARQT
jgi:hypothetical protein